jgi:Zn-dependent protease
MWRRYSGQHSASADTAGTGFDVSGPSSTAQAIGVLAAIVAFHELGHFVAARAQGIHVSKFSVGFGPSLLSWKVRWQEPYEKLIQSHSKHQ